mgnify:FL=1
MIKYLKILLVFIVIIFISLIFFKKEVIFLYLKDDKYAFTDNKETTLNEVWVTGLNNELKENIIKAVKYNIGDYVNIIDIKRIKERIDELNWIESSKVIIYPHGIMEIIVEEYIPFAIYYDTEKYFLINKNGYKFIEIYKKQYPNFFEITGKDSLDAINNLKDLVYYIYSSNLNLDKATRIDSRRWDLYFKNDMHIKLPADNSLSVLKKFINFDYNNIEFKNINIIDLRIPDRMILKYK